MKLTAEIPGLFQMFLQSVNWDALILIALLVAGVCAFALLMAAIKLGKGKLRKEIGLWIRHNRYKPARPKRTLHF